jgi:hypothetical protein
MKSKIERPFRPGDVVEVRSAAEILATLSEEGSVDNMPFMPEMLQYVGRRYTVSRRVDKICDTVSSSQNWSRRMHSTVYLDDLRCDGSRHDGCQAGCKIYWKDAWLRRVGDKSETDLAQQDRGAINRLELVALAGTRTERDFRGERIKAWRCQATDALKASTRMKTSYLPQYWRELTNGNYRPWRFFRLLARGFVMEIASRVGLLKPLPLRGSRSNLTSTEPLNLRPGELVEVRSPTEIAATLDNVGMDRGLSFDREMLPYCGRTFRVRDRVEKIIDDKTGRMLKISKDCVILEGAYCSGECTPGNWFCPRQIYSFWREAWLRRVQVAERNEP